MGLALETSRARFSQRRCLLPHQSFGKVCVLSNSEAESLEKDGLLPNCRDHRHVGRRAAEELVSTPTCGSRRAARSVLLPFGVKAKPAITFLFSPNWRLSVVSDPSLPSLPGGPRLKTLQLIP